MKKILVLSDSHGNIDNMIYAIEDTVPDMIIHLGDCWSDIDEIIDDYDIPIERVPGNCDYEHEFLEKIIEIEGKSIMICHGHKYNVKSGYLNIEMAALEKEVDAVMFGHTHRVFYDYHNGLFIFNPGSVGAPAFGVPASYGIVYIDSRDNTIRHEIKYIE
ncbi:MAG: YfcE family phosphodiesterase [Agathobacter sp.]|nr:YfcE family phosphodiesterase [Agathobacter sp.]